jgi:hypothetical protein
MDMIRKGVRIAAGATLLFVVLYVILALPGFLSDRDSMVAIHLTPEASQLRR